MRNRGCGLTLSSTLAELGVSGVVLLDVAQLLAEATVERVQVELATFELLQSHKRSRGSGPRDRSLERLFQLVDSPGRRRLGLEP